MKFELDTERSNIVSTSVIAKFLNLSESHIRRLSDDGFLEADQDGEGTKRRYDLIPTVNTYIEYWKNKAKNADLNLTDEQRKLKADADWKEARADIEAMKRDEIKGSLHSSDDVLKITLDMVMAVRASLLALPGMCSMDCANAQTAAEASGIIKNAVNDILNGLTDYEYNPEKYKELVRERETWIRADNEE